MELRDYQERIANDAVKILQGNFLCYLSMECRTGKTITAMAAAERFGARYVLFVTKKKAIPSIWGDYEALSPSFMLDVINYESVTKIVKEGNVPKSGHKYDFAIIDEAHSIGAFPKPSKRAKDLKAICVNLPILYLSGTPSPESYSQLYHQFWISSFSPWRGYSNFYKWAKAYVIRQSKRINGFDVADYSVARKDFIDRDTKHLFIDWSQEDAGFDCNICENVLTATATPQTKEYIRIMKRDRVLNLEGGTVLGDTPAKFMSKLHQLSSGTVITESGEHLVTDTFKADFIRRHFAGRKIAIFYVYQTEAELLHDVFPDWTESPEEFQSRDDLVFISQVRRAREGVRLDTADALIFFNLEYSYLSYEQGRNRLVSKERTSPANVYFVISDCGIEGDILGAVKNKTDFTYSYFKSKERQVEMFYNL